MLTTELSWVDQSHEWQGEAEPSMRLINPICFRNESVTNLSVFVFPKTIKRHIHS